MFTKRKNLIGCLAGAFLVWVLISHQDLLTLNVYAQVPGNNVGGITQTTWAILAEFFDIIQFLTALIVYQLELLLDPHVFLDAFDTVPSGNPLLKIWRYSRDIVNVILAFILIAGAAITVVTAKKDFLQTHAKNFVLAVILVNFSWFFPRVILDVANVLTAAVYTIPNGLASTCQTLQNNAVTSCKLWSHVVVSPLYPQQLANSPGWRCIAGNQICFQEVPMDANANTPGAILTGLVLNHARLADMGKIRVAVTPVNGAKTNMQDLITKLMQTALSTVLLLALFFPLAAMFVVFIIRIPIIWLTIAFMPFMFIGVAIGEKMGKFNTKIIFEKFIHAAFLPFVISIPLCVGFILLNAGVDVMRMPNPALGAHNQAGQAFLLFLGITTFWQFMWYIMTFGVLWVGTFAAFKIDSMYEKVGNTFKGYGQQVGKLAMYGAMSIPFIPGLEMTKGGRKVPITPLALKEMIQHGPQLGIQKLRENALRGTPMELGMSGRRAAESMLAHPRKDNFHADIKVHINKIFNSTNAADKQAGLADLRNLMRVHGATLTNADEMKEFLEKISKDSIVGLDGRSVDTIIDEVKKIDSGRP